MASGKIYLYPGDKLTKKIYAGLSNGEVEIKKAYSYPGNKLVYSSGHIVTYHIDTNNTITQEVDDGADCISNAPSATKSGWTFHGWREDATASSSVLPSKTCDADNIHLYAVFVQTITVTLYNNSASAAHQTGYKCYNNGNTANPSFAPVVATVSGWNIRGWSTSSGASAAITYNSGASFTTGSNITLYASWSRTVTVSYNGNGSTSGSTANSSGTAYRNYKGDITNTSITLRANGYARTNYVFTQWAMGSASGTKYNAGATVSLSANTTFYAYWVATSVINKTFSFTGTIQSYTAPAPGIYTLETWGAQGGYGWLSSDTGKGGYAKGNVILAANQVIYACVGGAGTFDHNSGNGGYNGGGEGYYSGGQVGGGGGATHFGKQNALLKDTSAGNLLIVAGGGGGSAIYGDWEALGYGGAGGGANGSNGTESTGSGEVGTGGSQSSGGWMGGSYGQGGSGTNNYDNYGPGGGGGYYGGGHGRHHAGSGGGSGYVGGCISGTASMSNGVQGGNGYAKITYVSA